MNDTIAGIATAMGQGGIAIIRVSGASAESIMHSVFRSKANTYESHKLYYGHLIKNDTIADECMAVIMKAPKSYTREDVLEIHTHGGDLAAMQALDIVLNSGARLAEPGEFTKRAFINGRIDLSQAEAVMSIINATGESSLRSATRQLEGVQSKLIVDSKNKLIDILAGIEAAIDYPEEISELEALADIMPKLESLRKSLTMAIDERSARLVREGLTVVIAGNPNAGKSTLFNSLLNRDEAIVTNIPGTTRDLLKATITINGVLVHLIDTAGMRNTDDTVEAIGVQRAKQAISNADTVLYAIDGAYGISKEDLDFIRQIDTVQNAVVLTKSDMSSNINIDMLRQNISNMNILYSSSIDKNGTSQVLDFLKEQSKIPKTMIFTHLRHVHAVKSALNNINKAINSMKDNIGLDLVAIDLKEAMYTLGEITGESLSEELIDKIFESFCVGK